MGNERFPLFEASRPGVGPKQPAAQLVPGVITQQIKRPERAPDHLHLSSAEV